MALMTPPEMDIYLREPNFSHLSTVGPDGAPHVAPVWHHYDGEELLVLAEPKAVKIRNIRHEPRVSIAITTTVQPYSFLQFNGVATLSDQWEKELLWSMSINYQGQEEGERYAERTYRESTFTLITVTPTKVKGWAF